MTDLLETLRAFLHNERFQAKGMSLDERLRWFRHGFLSKSAGLYGLENGDADRYVSDLQLRKTGSINEPHRNLLDHKPLFHALLAHNHTDRLPPLFGRIDGGQLGATVMGDPAADSLAALLDKYTGDGLICKPASGTRGEGVFTIRGTKDQYMLDNRLVGRAAVLARLRSLDGYLVCGRVSQAEYAAEIFPDAVNTIRILTMIDPETNEPFVGTAVHRFGTAASAPVDNWSAGGICAGIDPTTGELTAAAKDPDAGQPTFRDRHPDTDVRITDTIIPAWEQVREAVLSIAGSLREYLPYVGWDLVLTDHDGAFMFIEANSRTDVDLLQIHEPLLDDERVRRFYEYYGIC